MSKLVILSDDITGCVDSGALLCSAGCRVKVSVDPGKGMPEDFPDGVLSVNLSSRTLQKEKARDLFYQTGRQMTDLCTGTVMKKLDTGFRGNASQEIEGLMKALGRDCCFLVAHAPWREIYTLHGCQYFEGKPLDRSMVSREDPLKRPVENSLVRILSQDTSLTVCSVDIDEVRGDALCTSVKRRLAEGYQLLVFDAVTVEDSKKIVGELLDRFPNAVWAGSGGLTWGFAEVIFHGVPVWGPDVEADPDLRSVCFSASAYSVTKRQIRLASDKGLVAEIPVGISAFLANEERELKRVTELALRHSLDSSIMVTPDVDRSLTGEELPMRILDAIRKCATRICREAEFDRLVVIGGETAQSVLDGLGINLLEVTRKTETGIGTGLILDSPFAGKSFSFKGGVGGSPLALCRMLGADC